MADAGRGLLAQLGFDLALDLVDEALPVAGARPFGVQAEPLADSLELRLDLVDAAEVRQAQPSGPPGGDRAQGALPGLDVDVRRRRRSDRELGRGQAHARDIAHVGVAAGCVEVDDVVAGVTGRVDDPKALDLLPAAERDHVRRRHRRHLAP